MPEFTTSCSSSFLTLIGLLRRLLLSIFSPGYRFGHREGSRVWRVWHSVRTELRVCAALEVFAFHDTRRLIDELVYSTDASTGAGEDSISRHGGMVLLLVTSNLGLSGTLLCVLRSGDTHVRGQLAHVNSHFAPRPPIEVVRSGGGSDLENVSRSMVLGRYSPAGRLGFHARGPPQMSRTGKLQLTLCDNLALTLALAEGRSSSARLNTTCCELCAVSIFNDISVVVSWLPSEWNSSDRGSRVYGPPPRDFFCDARKVCAEAAPPERATREEAEGNAVQTARRLRPAASALDHCSPRGIDSHGTGVLTKRRLVSDTHRIVLEFRRSRIRRSTLREESITPRRGA